MLTVRGRADAVGTSTGRSAMTSHRVLTRWTGFCPSCPEERPLLLVSHGPHGLRAWLSGAGPEDRTLSYSCGVCGRSEHVPATEEEDAAYDATLARWSDWDELVTVPVPAPRLGRVQVVTLPTHRVSPTDQLIPAA
jgi:hypothetical protein